MCFLLTYYAGICLFHGQILSSSFPHAIFFFFLIFSWLGYYVTLEVFFSRTNLKYFYPWSTFKGINCQNGPLKPLLFA